MELSKCKHCGGEGREITEGEPGHENKWIECMACGSTAPNEGVWNLCHIDIVQQTDVFGQILDNFLPKLVEISLLMKDQDPRCTALPLYCVQHQQKVYVADECSSKYEIIHEGECVLDHEDCPDIEEWFRNPDNREDIIDTYMDEEKYLSLINDSTLFDHEIMDACEFTKVYFDYIWVCVDGQVYFTEKACEAHIAANHYHYYNPRSYVVGAWRNPEMEMIMEFLTKLTGGEVHR